MCNNIRHQPDIHHDIVASRGDPLSLYLSDQCLSRGHLIGDHCINNSLGLFNRTNQDSRSVGCHLLLWVPRVLDQRRGVGRVESHTANVTTQWKGLECPNLPDPIPWEIWARPIRFMQRCVTAKQSISRLCSRRQVSSLTRPLVF